MGLVALNDNVSFEEKMNRLNKMIELSKSIVFFGGAGVSTASGIPDFRSKDGLYNQKDIKFDRYSPEYLLSKGCLDMNPKVFYEFYRQKLDTRKIKPNITHYKLAELEKSGKLKAVITQNIDGLHQKAGSKTVLEIHGTTQRNYCEKCGKEFSSDYIFENTEDIPKCDECGGKVRPDVTLYGEQLPKKAWADSIKAIGQADMMIVAGTSLQVYPAANLIDYYLGSRLVVINKEKSPTMNFVADLMIEDDMTKVFKLI